jgi:hypothetical protein
VLDAVKFRQLCVRGEVMHRHHADVAHLRAKGLSAPSTLHSTVSVSVCSLRKHAWNAILPLRAASSDSSGDPGAERL